MDLETLPQGYRLQPATYTFTRELVKAYLDAVQDRSPLYGKSALVPPMAVAALAMRAVLEGARLTPGTVHAAQDLEFASPVSVGEEVVCSVTVAQNSVRREWRFLVLEVSVNSSRGRSLMQGKTTLLVPQPATP